MTELYAGKIMFKSYVSGYVHRLSRGIAVCKQRAAMAWACLHGSYHASASSVTRPTA